MFDGGRIGFTSKVMALLCIALGPLFGQPSDSEAASRTSAFLNSLPNLRPPAVDETRALSLVGNVR